MRSAQVRMIAFGVMGLALLWGLSRLLTSGTDRPGANFRLPSVAPDSVDTITVTTRAETVVVTRVPSGWTVNGFAAATMAVQELFAALQDTSRPEVVARSSGSYARLGVDTPNARHLTITGDGRSLLDLMVSEQQPDAGGAYVRKAADSAVYTWPGRLGQIVRRAVDDWRDKVIATLIPDRVERVTIERGQRRHSIWRRDSAWAFTTGSPADSAAVARLLERFRTVTASGFPTRPQLDSAFRGPVERRVSLLASSDSLLVALEFDSTATGFWTRRSGGDTVYRMALWEADQLTPSDSALRPAPGQP